MKQLALTCNMSKLEITRILMELKSKISAGTSLQQLRNSGWKVFEGPAKTGMCCWKMEDGYEFRANRFVVDTGNISAAEFYATAMFSVGKPNFFMTANKEFRRARSAWVSTDLAVVRLVVRTLGTDCIMFFVIVKSDLDKTFACCSLDRFDELLDNKSRTAKMTCAIAVTPREGDGGCTITFYEHVRSLPGMLPSIWNQDFVIRKHLLGYAAMVKSVRTSFLKVKRKSRTSVH
jgi:hypothetical protein